MGPSCVMSLDDNPMCIAVSCLSPVSIHTFIPAFINASIVLGTYNKKNRNKNEEHSINFRL